MIMQIVPGISLRQIGGDKGGKVTFFRRIRDCTKVSDIDILGYFDSVKSRTILPTPGKQEWPLREGLRLRRTRVQHIDAIHLVGRIRVYTYADGGVRDDHMFTAQIELSTLEFRLAHVECAFLFATETC